LEEVKLDACGRCLGSFVEVVSGDVWKVMEAERKRKLKVLGRRVSGGSGVGGMVGAAGVGPSSPLPPSRLPVLVRSPSNSSMRRRSSSGSGSASPVDASEKPPMGWCRLVGRDAIRRVALFEGNL
jgi:hypothetical protein